MGDAGLPFPLPAPHRHAAASQPGLTPAKIMGPFPPHTLLYLLTCRDTSSLLVQLVCLREQHNHPLLLPRQLLTLSMFMRPRLYQDQQPHLPLSCISLSCLRQRVLKSRFEHHVSALQPDIQPRLPILLPISQHQHQLYAV
jgi:hypothetical protein